MRSRVSFVSLAAHVTRGELALDAFDDKAHARFVHVACAIVWLADVRVVLVVHEVKVADAQVGRLLAHGLGVPVGVDVRGQRFAQAQYAHLVQSAVVDQLQKPADN